MRKDSYLFFTILLTVSVSVFGFFLLYKEQMPSTYEYIEVGEETKEMVIKELTPIKGSIKGGESVIIKGENFPLKTEVFFNDKLASEVKVEDEGKTLVVTTPEASGSGMVSVFVTGYGVDLIEAPVKFFYLAE